MSTSAIFEPATAQPLGILFVYAHGAGGHMNDRGMLASTEHLRRRGFDVVRFNFLYRENGTSRPDPMPRLEQCIVAVASRARQEIGAGTLVLGGRSMGGRAASMLVAAGEFACDGLLLLAYPLHPAGRPEKLRDAHLARIKVPVLCLNGTRDALCQRDLMERAVGHARRLDHALAGRRRPRFPRAQALGQIGRRGPRARWPRSAAPGR